MHELQRARPTRIVLPADPRLSLMPLTDTDMADITEALERLEQHWAWVNPEPDAPQEWWAARHIARLPLGMTLAQAQASPSVQVTLAADVDTIDSGLNEWHQRFNGPQSKRPYESVTVSRNALLKAFDPEDVSEFRRLRDDYRINNLIPRRVVRSDNYGREPLYALKFPWPAGMFAQGGTVHTRVVATAEDETDPDVDVYKGHKMVATGRFIEMFPQSPETFIRGEGVDFDAAEQVLWTRWSQVVGCKSPTGDHEYETRGYRNGAGFCKHCDLFTSGVFDLAEIGSVCVVCGTGTNWAHVAARLPDGTLDPKDYEMVCETHAPPGFHEYDEARDDPARADEFAWVTRHLPDKPAQALTFDDRWAAHRQGAREFVDAQAAIHAAAQQETRYSG